MALEFTPVKPKRLYEEIVEQIRQLITGGSLKPGDKLLAERELAERLQVSRVSVREAIRTLETLGFLEIRPGEGTFIRNLDTDDIIRPLAMFLAVERSSLLDMFEVRRIFEAATASLAAARATPEEIAHLSGLVTQMKEIINLQDSEKGEEFDTAFHYAIAEATHNTLLIKLFRTVSEDFAKSISTARRQLFLESGANAQRIIDQHTRVCDAIAARDAEAASGAMLEHLTYAERELRKRLE